MLRVLPPDAKIAWGEILLVCGLLVFGNIHSRPTLTENIKMHRYMVIIVILAIGYILGARYPAIAARVGVA